jgi:fucose 4-O-acetylase-like acetyltransferase
MKKNRDQQVDIYRGIAIMLVLAGHLYWMEAIASLIYSFHLALFFIVTGFFIDSSSSKYSSREYFFGKFRGILVPYIIALIANLFLVQALKFRELGIGESFAELITVFAYSSSELMEAGKYQIYYWFMPFFFVYTLILFWIYKYFKKYIRLIFVLSLIASFSIYTYHINSQYLSDAFPWSVDKLPFVIPLGIAGNYIWKNKEWMFARKNLTLIVSGLVLMLGFIYKVDLRQLFISNIFAYFALSINGAIFVLTLADFLQRNLSDGSYSIKKLLVFLGENTMYIYLVHGIVYPIWHGAMGGPKDFSTSYNLTTICMSLVVTFMVKYIFAVLGYWSKRVKFKV